MAFKSGLERTVAANLSSRGIKWRYEDRELPYILEGVYHPDFSLPGHPFILEVKGYLDRESKRKMVAVKKAHPDIDIRFLFADANKRITGTRQTHGTWATKNGFKFCEREVPEAWLNEQQTSSL